MQTPEHFDLVVIGAGPAGEKGAAQAAYFGKRVAVIEAEAEVGGAAVNTGTIPSKTLRETALYFSGLKQRGLYGVDYNLRTGLNIRDFMHRLHEVQKREWSLIRHNLFRHRIELLTGRARFDKPGQVVVERADGEPRRLTAGVFLIATGSIPNRPTTIPFDDCNVFDSDTILKMGHLPRSMAVVGAGVIGAEYACIFAALGIEVTLIDGRDRPVPFADREITDLLQARMTSLGIRCRFREEVTDIRLRPAAGTGALDETADVVLCLKRGDLVVADSVLFAAGRNGNTASLALDTVGVRTNSRGQVEVDETYMTCVDGVYAAGDVVGFPALASTSMEQARISMCHAFGFEYKTALARVLPYGIYTMPEISMCGESEESCESQGIPYLVGRASYRNNARGQIVGDTEGLMKLVFAPDTRRLLGVHIIGESASELVHTGMACLNAGGTIDTFIEAVYNFPTLSELYKYAAYDGLGKVQRMAEHRASQDGPATVQDRPADDSAS